MTSKSFDSAQDRFFPLTVAVQKNNVYRGRGRPSKKRARIGGDPFRTVFGNGSNAFTYYVHIMDTTTVDSCGAYALSNPTKEWANEHLLWLAEEPKDVAFVENNAYTLKAGKAGGIGLQFTADPNQALWQVTGNHGDPDPYTKFVSKNTVEKIATAEDEAHKHYVAGLIRGQNGGILTQESTIAVGGDISNVQDQNISPVVKVPDADDYTVLKKTSDGITRFGYRWQTANIDVAIKDPFNLSSVSDPRSPPVDGQSG